MMKSPFKSTPIVVGLCIVSSILLYLGYSFGVTTNTTLGITVGTFTFFKDTGTTMNSYYSPVHTGNAAASIDI